MNTRKRKIKSTSRKIKRTSRKGGAVLGKFYLLHEDENGFRPLYLTLQNIGREILSWSCPPEKYPKPHYTIRGMQQDLLPKSLLKNELEITKMTKRGENIVLTDGYYKIKLSKSWTEENNDLWESIVSNYDL
jgi:hypothetical protein